MLLALYGHLDSGGIWEKHFEGPSQSINPERRVPISRIGVWALFIPRAY